MQFAIFDVPQATGGFTRRLQKAKDWFDNYPTQFAFVIPQKTIKDKEQLKTELQQVEKLGGEGLIVRKPDALYTRGRSREILKIKSYDDMEAVVKWFEERAPSYTITIASPNLMFAHIGQRNIVSMLLGTTVALILISLLLGIALRSVKFGLISLIPNLIPAAMGFGLWYFIDGQIGLEHRTKSEEELFKEKWACRRTIRN